MRRARFSLSQGVELMQGYLFCKPAFNALGKIDSAAGG
jgi:EAL domain-containing protein (putative c-di-GMP-specific phosphodiesterase class I)